MRFWFMFGLIVAGEAIFGLPFHVTRFFRKTVLDVFGLTNTELGRAQAIYGITAMVAYVIGGPLADRFSARTLLCGSLLTTSAGGLYMATFPGLRGSLVLWGFFGFSTILMFWGALIRATREWGGEYIQGRAFGLLDCGRGVIAATLATFGVIVFAQVFPDGQAATLTEKEDALRTVIYGYTIATGVAALIVWVCLPQNESASLPGANANAEPLWPRVKLVLRRPLVWLQAIIVLCAYVGYKGFDNYALFAVEAYDMSESDAARLASYAAWLRPIAALSAGLVADRVRSSRVVLLFFGVLLISNLYFGIATPTPGATGILLANLLLASTAVFALRGVYFALFKEAHIPHAVTGTAVGIVSVIGYTPDIFVSWTGGVLLDRSPGVTGHQHFFLFVAGFAALGLLAAAAFIRINRTNTLDEIKEQPR